MNFKLLRAFAAVARHLSFRRAAAELGRSQATLSLQVRELENQLGVALLQRTTRRVSLTEPGARLAQSLAVGFGAIEEGLTFVQDMCHERRGRIVMACVPSLSSTQLPAMLARFRAQDSTTHIEVRELTSREIFAALADRVIDFGIGPCTDPPPADISFTPAIDDPLYALIPEGLDIGTAEGVSLGCLLERPLVTLSGSVLLQDMLDRATVERGMEPRTRTEVCHVHTAIAMARAGVSPAIVPWLALPDAIDGGVRAVPVSDPGMTRKIGLITVAGRPLEGKGAKLASHIRSALARKGR